MGMLFYNSFDVVLGCDLVYDSGVVDILVATVMHLLAENSTFLYVCGEHRLVSSI